MTQAKINWNSFKKLQMPSLYIQRKLSSALLIAMTTFLIIPVFAQTKDTTASNPASNGDDFFNQIIEYSRPGKYHQLLANLVGTWKWQGGEHSGTLVRKPFANGRFFIVELTSSKNEKLMQSPIQDGKMQETTYQTVEIEGFDNVQKKFTKSLINNHVGSFIVSNKGSYDSTKNVIVFEAEVEILPGVKWKTYEHFIFLDNDHYKIESYQQEDTEKGKVNEAYFTRVKGK